MTISVLPIYLSNIGYDLLVLNHFLFPIITQLSQSPGLSLQPGSEVRDRATLTTLVIILGIYERSLRTHFISNIQHLLKYCLWLEEI